MKIFQMRELKKSSANPGVVSQRSRVVSLPLEALAKESRQSSAEIQKMGFGEFEHVLEVWKKKPAGCQRSLIEF